MGSSSFLSNLVCSHIGIFILGEVPEFRGSGLGCLQEDVESSSSEQVGREIIEFSL